MQEEGFCLLYPGMKLDHISSKVISARQRLAIHSRALCTVITMQSVYTVIPDDVDNITHGKQRYDKKYNTPKHECFLNTNIYIFVIMFVNKNTLTCYQVTEGYFVSSLLSFPKCASVSNLVHTLKCIFVHLNPLSSLCPTNSIVLAALGPFY